MNSIDGSRPASDALGPASRAELLHVFMLPEFDRVDGIGEFAELPIDCEEDRLRVVLVDVAGSELSPRGHRAHPAPAPHGEPAA